jgi:hypothetical protein
MRKIGVRILIVFSYCFPFVYFSMYQDFANSSMFGYLIMIVVTSLLAFFSKLFSNSIPLIIGNITSGIISIFFISRMTGIGNWDFYFKPFPPSMLLIVVSVLNLIPQFLAIKLANRYKNTVKD